MPDLFPKLFSVDVPNPRQLALNADHTLLAVGNHDEDIAIVLDLADGKEVARVEGIALRDLEAFEFYGDKLLAIREGGCVFYDVRRKKFETIVAPSSYPQSATIDPTGRFLAIGVESKLILYDLKKQAIEWSLETNADGAPLYPRFSPGGRFVAADFVQERSGGFLLVWDTADGKRWRTIEIRSQGNPIVAFRGDTRTFVLGQNGLKLYEPDQGDEPVARFPKPEYPTALTFRDDGKTLAAIGWSAGLVVIDMATGAVIKEIDQPDGRKVGYSAPSPDWSLIASGTEGGVLVWPSGLGAASSRKKKGPAKRGG